MSDYIYPNGIIEKLQQDVSELNKRIKDLEYAVNSLIKKEQTQSSSKEEKGE